MTGSTTGAPVRLLDAGRAERGTGAGDSTRAGPAGRRVAGSDSGTTPERRHPPGVTPAARDADARARRLVAVRRWHSRAEQAARRAARASSAVR